MYITAGYTMHDAAIKSLLPDNTSQKVSGRHQ